MHTMQFLTYRTIHHPRVCIPARSFVHPRYLQHARFAHARRRLGNVSTMGKASPFLPRERSTRDTIVRLLDRGFFPAFQPGARAVPPPQPLFSLGPGANATSPGVNRTIQSFKVKHNAIIRRAPAYTIYGSPQQYMLYACVLLIWKPMFLASHFLRANAIFSPRIRE